MLLAIIIMSGILSAALYYSLSEVAVGIRAARSAVLSDDCEEEAELVPLPAPAPKRVAFAKLLRDDQGNKIDMTDRMLAVARGGSCGAHGVPDGATVVVDKFGDNVPKLSSGDIVVIDSITEFGTKPMRFRAIKHVEGDIAHFHDDQKGRPLNSKPVTDIIGRAVFVL